MAYEFLVVLTDLGLLFAGGLLLGVVLIGGPMWLADRWCRRGQNEEPSSLFTDD